ncbi:hypothetical protein A6046_06195 [[Haemophilus] ducreyi]|uniref:Uncharacterized protein n=2 Tax=Haemophilus ducreyi TaxID=730 RepID=Q7VKT2_HAEDU|nr:secA translation cis-regulator SecM [[Haemophilus] ducreyi]AAP96540.1 hypothetical protein HD_1789 [[Haemophilus] ducreyi 35000HP]AKO31394.1 hypothetical protein RY60_06885 [[Haemophilus] ducreyi]AKO32846.1 hypothetical protein RZ57_06960 [[Haemophilus] ducreyi]AKO34294.1 hypothetical protein RZ58_06950 [[Haemophilus] ducreyi]AKO35737.1 hypothetical protein RZ59_06875 [[Haemophilus] ducreyi]
MSLFKHFHKTPFWSQLVFGVMAILALPEFQTTVASESENEQNTIINQAVMQSALSVDEVEQQALFVELKQIIHNIAPQAVVFYDFLTKCYRFEVDYQPPIRAGPFI